MFLSSAGGSSVATPITSGVIAQDDSKIYLQAHLGNNMAATSFVSGNSNVVNDTRGTGNWKFYVAGNTSVASITGASNSSEWTGGNLLSGQYVFDGTLVNGATIVVDAGSRVPGNPYLKMLNPSGTTNGYANFTPVSIPSGGMSFSIWVKHTYVTNRPTYFVFISGNFTQILCGLTHAGLLFHSFSGEIAIINGGYKETITDGNWHHLVSTISASGLHKFYLDNSLILTYQSAHPGAGLRSFYNIGASNTGDSPINGAIDNFKFFTRELTALEVTAEYNNTASNMPFMLMTDSGIAPKWMPKPAIAVDDTETNYTVKSNEVALTPGTNSTYAVWTATKSTNLKIDVSFADYHTRNVGVGFQMFKIKSDNTFDSVLFPRTVTSTALTNAAPNNYLSIPTVSTSVSAGDKIYIRVDANGNTVAASSVLATTIFTDAVSVNTNPTETKVLQANLASNLNSGNANTVLDTVGNSNWQFYVAGGNSIAAISSASNSTEWTSGSLLSYAGQLTMHFAFDGNTLTGNTIVDSVSGTSTALLANGAKTSATQVKYGTGSLDFSTQSGVNVNCQHLKLPTIYITNSGFTVSFWTYLTALDADRYILNIVNSSTGDSTGLELIITADAYLQSGIFWTGVAGSARTTTPVVTVNQWQHMCFTITPSKFVSLYVNAVSVKTGTFSGDLFANGIKSQSILGTTYNGAAGMLGYIDDFRIYNRAITQSEVTAIYNGNANTTASLILPYYLKDIMSGATWVSTSATLVDSTETNYTVKSNEIALTPGTNSTYAVWTAPKSTNIKVDVSFADYHSRSAGVGFQMFKINADNTFGSVIFPRTVTSTALTNAAPTNYLTVPSRTISVAMGDKIYYRVDANGNTTSASSVLSTNIYVDPNQDLKQYNVLQANLGNNMTATSFVSGNANVVNDTRGTGSWKFYVNAGNAMASVTSASNSTEWSTDTTIVKLGNENDNVTVSPFTLVRFGDISTNRVVDKVMSGSFQISIVTFGDPAPGTAKSAYVVTGGYPLSYDPGIQIISNYSFDLSTKSGNTIKNLATNDYGLTLMNGATIKQRGSFFTTYSGGQYFFSGPTNVTQVNPTLTFYRGYTYTISTGHVNFPMFIQTVPSPYSSGNVYNTGITNNGTGTLVITIVVTNDTPSTLYYVSNNSTTTTGTINIVSGDPDTVLSMNVSSGQYATSSVPLSFSPPWTISFNCQFTGTHNNTTTVFEIGNTNGFGLRINGNNNSRPIESYQNGSLFSSQNYASANSTVYNHYALVYNLNGSFTGYYNGSTSVAFQGSPQLNVVSNFTYMNFGKSNMSSVLNPTTGSRVIEIDNFKIFNSALSASDVTALYNGTYVVPPATIKDTTLGATWISKPSIAVNSTETNYTVKSNEIALTPGTNSTYAVWTATKSTNIKVDVSFADYHTRNVGVGFQMFKIKSDNTFDSVLFPRTVTSTALTNANSSNYLSVPSVSTTVAAGDKIYIRVDANGNTTSASSVLATTIFTDAVSIATNPTETKVLQANLGNNLNATSFAVGNTNTVLDTLGTSNWKFYVAGGNSVASISSASASSEWTAGSVLPYVLPPSVPTDMSFWYTLNSNKVSGTTVYDSIGNYSATLFGGATISTASDSPGPGQGFLSLVAASSQYLQLPSFTTGTNGLTFACWFRSNATGNYARIFDFTNGLFNNMILFGLNTNGFFIDVDNSLTNEYAKSDVGGISMNDNVWRHVVLIFHPTNGWTLYLNGVSYYTDALGPYPDAVSRTINYIGKSVDSSPYLNGGVDDLRVYNRVITADEISLIYSQSSMYYQFETVDINPSNALQVGEYSTGSYIYNGTLVGGATIAVDANSRIPGQGYLKKTASAHRMSFPPIFTGTNGLTFALWFRITTVLQNFALFDLNDGGDLNNQISFMTLSSGGLFAVMNNNSTECYSNNNFFDGVWRHFGFTITPISGTATIKLYVNGSLVSTFTTLQYPISKARLNNYIFNGVAVTDAGADDFRFYNRALTQAEVTALYAGPPPPSLKDTVTGAAWVYKPAFALDPAETSYTVKSTEIAMKPGTNSTYAVWTAPKSTNIKVDVSFADYHTRSAGVGFQMFKINADNTFGSVIFPRTVTSTALTNAAPTNYLTVPSRTISVAMGDKIYYRVDANGNTTSASSVLSTNIYVDPNQDLKQYNVLQANLGNNMTATSFVSGNANVVNDTRGTGSWKFYVAGNTSVASITGASASTEWTVGNLLSYDPGPIVLSYSFDTTTQTGSTVKNTTTNSYDLTLYNGATIATASPAPNSTENAGYLSINVTSGQYAQSSAILSLSQPFSVSFWFKRSGTGPNVTATMFEMGDSNLNAIRYSDNNVVASHSNGSQTETGALYSLYYGDANWHHLVFVLNGGSLYSYGDGSLSRSMGAQNYNVTSNFTYFSFGKSYIFPNPTSGTCIMNIDKFQIFNTALSGTQITALYNGTYIPPTPTLKHVASGATWISKPSIAVDSTETNYTVKSNEVALTPGTNSTYAVWTATKTSNLKIDVSFADYHTRNVGVGFQMFKIKSDNTFDSVLFPRTVTSTALTNAAPNNYLSVPSVLTTVIPGDKIYLRVDANGNTTSASSVLATAIYTDAVSVNTNPAETRLTQANLASNLNAATLVAGNVNTVLDTVGNSNWQFYVAGGNSIAAISSVSASSEWTAGSVLPYVLPPSVPTDMALWFPFTTTVYDSVANYQGTLVNGATLAVDTGSRVAGQGYLKLISTSTQYVSLTTPISTGANGLSFAFWYRLDATRNNQRFFSFCNSVHTQEIMMGVETGEANFFVCANTNDIKMASPIYNNNTWNHVVWTITPTSGTATWKIYLNGVPTETKTGQEYPNVLSNRTNKWIGRGFYTGSGDANYNGGIDDFQMYQRVLTDAEVSAIYIQPAMYYPFNVADINPSNALQVGEYSADTNSYSYNATLYGGATIAVDTGSRVAGQGYLSLSAASSQYLQLPSITTGSNGLSFSCWFRQNGNPYYSRIFEFGNGQSNNFFVCATGQDGAFGANDLLFTVYNVNQTQQSLTQYTVASLTNNTWRHMTWTMNPDGTWKIYINGTLIQTVGGKLYPQSIVRTTNYLGKPIKNGDGYLNGGIDEFRYYNRVITSTEVSAIYANTVSALPTDKVLSYNFNAVGVHAAVPTNGATISAGDSPGPGQGYLNLVAASSQYATVPTFTTGSNGLTFACWFRSNATADHGRIIDFGNGPDNNNIFIRIVSGNLSVVVNNGANQMSYNNVIPSVNDNVWRHIVWTLTNNSVWTFYINGTLLSTQTNYSYPPAVTRTSNYIGKSNWIADPYLNGGVDDFRLYNRVITTEEISLIYSQSSMYYPFETANINPYNSLQVGDYSSGSYFYNGTLVGGATIAVDSGSRIAGQGYLKLVAASNQYMQLPAFATGTVGLTFSFWFRSNGTGNNGRIFDFGNGPDNNNIFMAFINGNLDVVVLDGGAGNGYNQNMIASMNDNVWRHLVWTMTNSTNSVWKIYINGTLTTTLSSASYPGNISRTINYIGNSNWNNNPNYNGGIDDFRFYQRTITDAEVTALYNGPPPPALKDTVTGAAWVYKPATLADPSETSYTVKSTEIALLPGTNSTYAVWTAPKTSNIRVDVSFADYHTRSAGVGFQMFKINSDNTFGSVIFPRTVTSTALTNAAPTNYLSVPSRSLSVATGDKIYYRVDANGNAVAASSVISTNIYTYSGVWS